MKNVYPENAVFALIGALREQANGMIASLLEERGVHDLLPAHGSVLHALFQESPVRMSALAKRIGRGKSTLTSLINTLESRGYCRREGDPADSRAQMVRLTPKGEGLRDIQAAISAAALEKAWQGIDGKDRETCLRVLSGMLDNLRQ